MLVLVQAGLLALSVVTLAATATSKAFSSGSYILAQAGSAGGDIGKHGKSASGGEDAPRARPAKRTNATAKHSPSCPNIVGKWSSWASGIFGRNDTSFNKDGSAYHASGIPGKWYCENGQMHIEWSDGKPGVVKFSADGKQMLSSDGSVHMSRD